MSTLFNFDLFSNPIAYTINLLMFWLFWPGGMFLAGWIGESRLVPLWRRQSKMFFPGELSLGVMTLSLLSMHAKIGSKTSILWLWWFLPNRSCRTGNLPFQAREFKTPLPS